MARPVLTEEHKEQLLEWLTVGYPDQAIQQWFRQRGWPMITAQAISYHRIENRERIEAAKAARTEGALNRGLALKEERVRALVDHAAALEQIIWVPDEKGKLHNEKGWRETLDDIAKEMGHRRTGVDLNVGNLSDEELVTRTQATLDAGAAGAAAGDGEAGADPPAATGQRV
jgi:hypothetical protein